VALAGSHVVFRSIALAPNDPRTLQQAADMELEIATDPDFQGMCKRMIGYECFPGTRQLILALARPDAVQEAAERSLDRHVGLDSLIPSPVAVYYGMRSLITETIHSTLLLFMTADATELVVGTPTGILFMRSLSTGFNAGEETVGGLITVLGIYRKTFPRITEGILVCPDANAEKLAADMTARLRMPIRCAGLLREYARNDGVGSDAPSPLQVEPEYLLAYGLAVAGNDATARGLSFLPPAIQTDMRLRARKPYWIMAAVLGLAALGIFLAYSHAAVRDDRKKLHAEQARLEQTRALRDSLRTLQDDLTLIRDRDQAMRPLMRFPSAIRDILRILGTSLHPSDGLTSFTDAPNQALIIEGITPHADMKSV